jgi:hypothetical protein
VRWRLETLQGRPAQLKTYWLSEGQFSSDGVECCVDAGGKVTHTGSAGESDQSDQQSILDQILTLFIPQVDDREMELCDAVLHMVSPRSSDTLNRR